MQVAPSLMLRYKSKPTADHANGRDALQFPERELACETDPS